MYGAVDRWCMHEIETSLALWCQIVQHLNTVLCWQCVTHYGPSRAPTRVESHLISLYAHTLSIVLCSPLPFLPSLTTHSVVLPPPATSSSTTATTTTSPVPTFYASALHCTPHTAITELLIRNRPSPLPLPVRPRPRQTILQCQACFYFNNLGSSRCCTSTSQA